MEGELTGLPKLKAKVAAEPLVPLGALLTAGVLVGGIASFRRGNKVLAQKFMRARVVAQFGTMVAIGYGAYFTALSPKEAFDDSAYKGNLGASTSQ